MLIVHFDICTAFCPKCFLMAAGGSGGKGSCRKGENEPDFDSRFGGGIEAAGHTSQFVVPGLLTIHTGSHSAHHRSFLG